VILILGATVWSWVGVAGIAVLLVVAGRGVIRLNDRERADIDLRQSQHDRLPEALRLPSVPRLKVVGLFAASLAAGAAGGLILGAVGGAAAMAVVSLIIAHRITEPRREAERTVMERGRAMRQEMPQEDHEQLMRDLAAYYGRERRA
jgi:membrane protein implicated in regulation of membrane protease activity